MAKHRPTEEEFEELKRKRDEGIRQIVLRTREKLGWDPAETWFHASNMDGCYCACPDGPCQHVWDGPDHEEGNMISVTCSRCGAVAAYHDMRCGP